MFSEPLFVEVHDMCERILSDHSEITVHLRRPQPTLSQLIFPRWDFGSYAKITSTAGVKDRLNMAADKEEEFILLLSESDSVTIHTTECDTGQL